MKAFSTLENSYLLDITPQTSPRARSGKFGVYMEPEYKKYKRDIIVLMKMQRIPKGNYGKLKVEFHFPYPKSIKEKNRVNGSPYMQKPDWDNAGKAITDCLEEAGIIENDKQIWSAFVIKVYTTRPTGYIKLRLA